MPTTGAPPVSRGVRGGCSCSRAAQDVFVAQGFHAAAMDDIADRAGVSKPVLYQHFPGKRELYLALLEEHVSELADRVAEAMGGTDDNRARVDATVGAYFDFIDAEGEAFRLVFESDLRNDADVRAIVDRGTQVVCRGDRRGHRGRHRRRPRTRAAPGLRAHRAGRDQRPLVAAAEGHRVARRGGRAHVGLAWRGISGFPRVEGDTHPSRRVRCRRTCRDGPGGTAALASVGVSRANRGGIATWK